MFVSRELLPDTGKHIPWVSTAFFIPETPCRNAENTYQLPFIVIASLEYLTTFHEKLLLHG